MSRFFEYLVDAVRNPREQLSRGQHFVRHSWELTTYCWGQLQRHRAVGMAAELTYRTIFALIPVVVLGLVMFRIVGGLEEIQNKVENELYSFFGVPEIPEAYLQPRVESPDIGQQPSSEPDDLVASDATPQPPVEDSNIDTSGDPATQSNTTAETTPKDASAGPDTGEETRRQARASIRRTLHDVTTKVASIDFKSIGVFGLLLFIYAAVALADSTEHLFNRIYEAPSQRPIHIRLAIHWSIITLGSGLLAMSLYLSGQVVDWFGALGVGSTPRTILSHLLAIGASWVLLFLLYALMPNTHVSLRAAAIGSLVGAVLWEAAKFGFQIYVAKAVPYSAIYGSIGLIPLFLFWIYLTWLIFLFGLILTYTLQTYRGRLPSGNRYGDPDVPSGDPDWMLPIMCEVSHAFDSGNPIDNQELANQIGLSSRVVHDMTSKLVNEGMLRRVNVGADSEEALTLARPADKISIAEILGLAHDVRPTNDHPAWKTLANLKKAERDAAEGKTLADVQAW